MTRPFRSIESVHLTLLSEDKYPVVGNILLDQVDDRAAAGHSRQVKAQDLTPNLQWLQTVGTSHLDLAICN